MSLDNAHFLDLRLSLNQLSYLLLHEFRGGNGGSHVGNITSVLGTTSCGNPERILGVGEHISTILGGDSDVGDLLGELSASGIEVLIS